MFYSIEVCYLNVFNEGCFLRILLVNVAYKTFELKKYYTKSLQSQEACKLLSLLLKISVSLKITEVMCESKKK